MLQKLPVNNFQRGKDEFNFYEDLLETMMKIVTKDTCSRSTLSILRSYIDNIFIC